MKGRPHPRLGPALGASLLILLLLVPLACSTHQARTRADREAYRLIQDKTPRVPNMDPRFTIEATNTVALGHLPIVTAVPEYLGPEGAQETNCHLISLEQALDLAVHHSRTYQSSKEQVYLSALSLSLARYQFTPLFAASGRADLAGQSQQATLVGIDEFTGQPKVYVSDELVGRANVGASGNLRAEWLIRDLGRLSAAFTADFSRFLSGGPATLTSSRLSATFSRPLLRNAGFKREVEALTQAERNLLYALRTFTYFRKTFSVDTASAYYAVLGFRDGVRNAYDNRQRSRHMAARTRALAGEGRATQADLGRLAQQELTSETSWISAVRSYQQALDNFKIRLGLPTDAPILLDDADLQRLTIEHPDLQPEDCIRIALAGRLDLQNVRDQVQDADRQVQLAADQLKAQVDLVAGASIQNPPDQSSGFPTPEFDRYRWNAGLDLNLPLSQKAERNAYRRALIAEGQAVRNLTQQEDEIKLEVRDAWRSLDQAKRSFEFSELGVRLAERRVEEQELLAQFGRARALDQVDTQNSLAESRNQRTRALVEHTIARLRFWNSLGILYIKDNGQWQTQPLPPNQN